LKRDRIVCWGQLRFSTRRSATRGRREPGGLVSPGVKKFIRLLGIGVSLIVALLAIVLGYLFLVLPPQPKLAPVVLPSEPERIERGRYLAHHVTLCVECHSLRDQSLYAGPVKEESLGGGGEVFPGEFGTLVSTNLTPVGLAGWSDEQLYRAVVTGVRPDGGVLFPLMPFQHYATMDTRDVLDILAYIRTLKPIENSPPPSRLNFPFPLLVRTMAVSPTPTERPLPSDTVKYGEYLTNAASCTDCHTPRDKGAPIPGLAFAGGNEFPLPSGLVRSANLTPDKETGLGGWTREQFIERFKSPRAAHNLATPRAEGQVNTIMPWRSYAGMTAEDLGAIYDYLQTLPAVKNRVQTYGSKG
jgi:mono/diheme cytochrome c family protein